MCGWLSRKIAHSLRFGVVVLLLVGVGPVYVYDTGAPRLQVVKIAYGLVLSCAGAFTAISRIGELWGIHRRVYLAGSRARILLDQRLSDIKKDFIELHLAGRLEDGENFASLLVTLADARSRIWGSVAQRAAPTSS